MEEMTLAAGSRRPRRNRPTLVAAALLATALVAAGPASARAADATPPTEPGAIAVSGVTATSAALSWSGSSDDVGVEGYRVYRGPSSAPDSALQLIATTDAVTSYAARNLYSGSGYRFGVTAIDAANNQSPMRTVSLATAADTETTAPSPPVGTTVVVHAFSSTRIDVTWGGSSSGDVAGYRVLRDGTPVATVDLPNGLRYSDNGLVAGSSHAYAIRAVDSAGNESASSTARTATTLAAGTATIARGPYLSSATGTSAVVSWWTNVPTAGVVSWGAVSATEHSATDPAGSVRHHAVAITGLAPGTTVHYQVGDGGSLTSGPGSFSTAAPPGASFSFAALGDFGGGGPGETQNAARIAAADDVSFIQTVGDNIYPSAGNPDPDFATVYSDFDQRFFKPFATAVRGKPLFPANGNKEYYGDGTFWQAFPMPGDNHAWYAYDWGDAHIVVLDSELPFAPGTPQYAFAQADLAAHQTSPWRIVAIQRPAYSSSSANASSRSVQQHLVPLFQAQHVQLVLSGNSHNYERTFPLIDGARASDGVTYVVTGAGGNGFNAFAMAAPAWSAFREATTYEYLKVSVSAAAIRLAAIRADTGGVLDGVTIATPGGSPPPAPPPAAPPAPAPTTPPPSPPAPPVARPAPARGTCAVRLRGRAGSDRLRGTRSGDRLLGEAGDDLLESFGGRDCLFGMAGRDVLRGGSGSDRLWGGTGADRLVGGSGADELWGGAGADRLTGGSGRDRFHGGGGRDVIDARDGARESVDCGPGRDTARVDRRDRVRGCERVVVGA